MMKPGTIGNAMMVIVIITMFLDIRNTVHIWGAPFRRTNRIIIWGIYIPVYISMNRKIEKSQITTAMAI